MATKKILIWGDSISQGAEGDWTWRYRLARSLRTARDTYDFVGPRADLKQRHLEGFTPTGYRDPEFDREHAARWGMALSMPDIPAATLMADHAPDVLVCMLGVNDFVWWGPSAETFVSMMTDAVIAPARAANPNCKVVIGTIGHRWIGDQAQVQAYNQALRNQAPSLAESGTGVALLPDLDEAFDTYDGVHPSPRGELLYAESVRKALLTVGEAIGSTPITAPPLPAVPRPVGLGIGPWGTTGLLITWTPVPWSTGYEIEMRYRDILPSGPGAFRLPEWTNWVQVGTTPWRTTEAWGVIPPISKKRKRRFQFRVRTIGYERRSRWSSIVAVTR